MNFLACQLNRISFVKQVQEYLLWMLLCAIAMEQVCRHNNQTNAYKGDSDCFPSDSFAPGSVGRLCPEEADSLVDLGVGSVTTNTSSVAGFTCRSILDTG
jgi:hypothetical protein